MAFAIKTVHIVVVLNFLLAGAIFALAYALWGYRRRLRQLSDWLRVHERQVALGPKQLGYALTLGRVQLAATRLQTARWQQRSHQVAQVMGLVRVMQTILLYQTRRKRS